MKHLRLMTMSLVNFKGIEELNIDFQGADWKIYGDNATGKSTIYDGLTWLFFGKDSRGQSDFGIKPTNTSKLENSVKAEFQITDGDSVEFVVLERTQHEKWTKPRGSVEKRFDGNRTKFKIDSVPAKQGEFKKYIDRLCEEDLFRLLTNPLHFNENLHHTERREMLLTVCGTVSDADLVEDLSALADFDGLQAIFDKTPNLEDHRKKLAGERTLINREIQEIPTRIDQISKDMPETAKDVSKHPASIITLEKKINLKQDRIAEIKAGGVDPADTQLKMDLINQIHDLKSTHAKTHNEGISQINLQVNQSQARFAQAQGSLSGATQEVKSLDAQRTGLESENEKLRKEWGEIDLALIEFEEHSTCSQCGQDVPVGNAFRDQIIKKWNTRLAEIDEQGLANKNRHEALKMAIEQQYNIQDVAKGQLDDCNKETAKLEKMRKELMDLKPKGLEDLERNLSAVSAKLANPKEIDSAAILTIEHEIRDANVTLGELRADIARAELRSGLQDKVAKLEDQEKLLAKRFEETERELHMIEMFIREKVSRLDEIINSKFDLVKFKLFKELQTGGIEDVCVCQINGVDYKDLNSAGRIQAGLDIIATLSTFHEFAPVVFVDNRETVVELPEIPAQVISLIVDGSQAEMKFVTIPREDAENDK